MLHLLICMLVVLTLTHALAFQSTFPARARTKYNLTVQRQHGKFLCSLSVSKNSENHHNDHHNNNNNNNNNNKETLVDTYTPMLNSRLSHLRASILEEQIHKPPNPSLDPVQLITILLDELREHDDTTSTSMLPDSGYRILLRSSTKTWKKELRKSVGAPSQATEEQLVSALSAAMSRPNNQYQILVAPEENDGDDVNECYNGEKYHLYFPGDVFHYDEGKAWVESQLRHPRTGSLLSILAWGLSQRESDGSWLIDELDWQDFRDKFRPGIGREEWSRICG